MKCEKGLSAFSDLTKSQPMLHMKDYTTHINAPRFPLHLSSFLENTHEVVLKKSLSGLGFSFNISQLRSGPDRGSVVRIKRLFPGQPALESGLLQEGDVILSVNKEPVKDLSYQVELGVFKVIFNPYIFMTCSRANVLPSSFSFIFA